MVSAFDQCLPQGVPEPNVLCWKWEMSSGGISEMPWLLWWQSRGCTALHHSLLWQDLAPFGFPAHECGSEGLIECFPASLAGVNHKEGTYVSGVSDLPLLPSLCVRILTDSSALLNRLQEPPQSVGSQTTPLSAVSTQERQPRLPSVHSKKQLSFNCFYQIVVLPAWVNETLKEVEI